MAAPPNEFAFDASIVAEAAENWRRRAAVRDQQLRLPERKYTVVEPRERLAKRANRLLDQVRRAVPASGARLSPALRELVRRGPIDPGEMNDALMERVIGETRDFLSAAFLDQGTEVMRSVGRVVIPMGGGRESYGTGFLVSPRLLLTNWHVLPEEDAATGASVEFDFQIDRQRNPLKVQRYAFEPRRFFLNDRSLDFALVAVAERSDGGKALGDYDYCRLIADEGKIVASNCVNIIQHPLGEMKQVVVRENKLIDVFDDYLHYEADTEPGSSGSVVCNDQWEAVALHHSGVPATDADGGYLTVDGYPWKDGDDPTRLKWIANEGIRVSRLVAAIRSASVREHERELREELLALSGPESESTPPGRRRDHPGTQAYHSNGGGHDRRESLPVTSRGDPAASSAPGTVTFTVPITITVSLGLPDGQGGSGGVLVQAGPASDPRGPSATENTPPRTDYSDRAGYDPEFVGFAAPLPTLSNSIRGDAVKVAGAPRSNPYELKYHHFSVIMNGRRRLAFVSAVNLDGKAPRTVHREGADQWFFDGRISRDEQAGPELYSNNPLDRGHLTRRADAAWGRTDQEAERANSDTFHWTNCSPQHEVFNQSQKASQQGLLLWGNLENHVADQARGQRLSVMNGPIFAADDREYRGIGIPRAFWKVIVYLDANGRPGAAAFKLSQADLIGGLPRERFEPGEFKPVQVRIRDLESETRLDFGKLRGYDPLEQGANESYLAEGTDHVILQTARDLVL